MGFNKEYQKCCQPIQGKLIVQLLLMLSNYDMLYVHFIRTKLLFIYYIYITYSQIYTNMDFKLVSPTDFALLVHLILKQSKILQKLQQKYKGHSNLDRNFYRSLPDNGEKPFAIALKNGQIKIIYELIHELKFTRGMQPVIIKYNIGVSYRVTLELG